MTTAINAYLVQIVKRKGLPFSLTLQNERELLLDELSQSLEESRIAFENGQGISQEMLREKYRKKREGLTK